MPEAKRRIGPWIAGGVMVAVTAVVVIALLTSQISGTGAENVGSRTETDVPSIASTPSATAGRTSRTPEPTPTRTPTENCEPTESNPGGRNNYIPDAPQGEDLGDGFVIAGLVRSAEGCRPLADVRVQVWLATESGSEQDNRTSVRTGADGRFSVETDPTVPQFGEPNIHVAYDDGDYEPVFIRRVVELDDDRATIDLTLQRS